MTSDIVRPPAFQIWFLRFLCLQHSEWFQRFLRLRHSEYDFGNSSVFSIQNMISEIPPPPTFEYDFRDSFASSFQNMISEIPPLPAFRIWVQHSEYEFLILSLFGNLSPYSQIFSLLWYTSLPLFLYLVLLFLAIPYRPPPSPLPFSWILLSTFHFPSPPSIRPPA